MIMRVSTFVFVVCCGAGLCVASVHQAPQPSHSAQPSQPPREELSSQPTFRTGAAGVQIDVLVTDDERPVSGLTAKDFELTDSGVAQDIEVTTLSDLPVDVIIVLDVSTSLREQGLRHLVRATDTLLGSLRPRDRAGLVTFSQVVTIRSSLTPEHTRVRAIVRDLRIEGTTSAIDAVFAGTTLQTAARASLLLVFSDGVDNASWLRPDQVLATVRRSAVVEGAGWHQVNIKVKGGYRVRARPGYVMP
jgi:hypothetical protein